MEQRRAGGRNMVEKLRKARALTLLVCVIAVAVPHAAWSGSARELDRDGAAKLNTLRKSNVAAEKLASTAKAILVFPSILKAGFMFGGQIGEGVLMKKGKATGYYSSVAASYGLQAGIQDFGYALFFMDDESLKHFESSSGFEIGVGPSIVVVDEGFGKAMTTTTIQKGIYAFIFDQKGLMAGLGIQGSKITKISK
jgi:lipid-binding SYLF domain-containing protein